MQPMTEIVANGSRTVAEASELFPESTSIAQAQPSRIRRLTSIATELWASPDNAKLQSEQAQTRLFSRAAAEHGVLLLVVAAAVGLMACTAIVLGGEDFWSRWWQGKPVDTIRLLGPSLRTWGRIGKTLEFLGATTIVVEIIGLERLRRFGESLQSISSRDRAWHLVVEVMSWPLSNIRNILMKRKLSKSQWVLVTTLFFLSAVSLSMQITDVSVYASLGAAIYLLGINLPTKRKLSRSQWVFVTTLLFFCAISLLLQITVATAYALLGTSMSLLGIFLLKKLYNDAFRRSLRPISRILRVLLFLLICPLILPIILALATITIPFFLSLFIVNSILAGTLALLTVNIRIFGRIVENPHLDWSVKFLAFILTLLGFQFDLLSS